MSHGPGWPSKLIQKSWALLNRWFLLALLLLSLTVLEGCVPGAPSASKQDEAIHLTLWQGVNPPPNRAVLQSLVDRFNQTHPNIQVESLYVGQPDQQLPKILAAVVGNASPDLLWYIPTIAGQLVELDAIRPLDDWLAASPMHDQIDPALFGTMEFRDHIWSVPFATNNAGIFYRPSLFQAAGVTQLPQTWDELHQVAQTLTRDTNGDGRTDQHGMLLSLGKGEFTVFTWLPFLWSAGGEITLAESSTNSGQSVSIVSPGAIAALQFWQDLVQDGSAVLSQPERGFELDQFLAGKVAMQISGPWTLGQLQQMDVDFGVIPFPAQVQRAAALGGENLFVFKTTPERERAAFTFAEYVLSEEFQTQWALQTGYLPVNLRSRESAAYKQFMAEQPALSVFLDQMAIARSRPIFPGYARVSENLGRAMEATLLGQTPTEALKASQQRLDLVFNHAP
jgi:multiple sugar transport system substrate-binding protein